MRNLDFQAFQGKEFKVYNQEPSISCFETTLRASKHSNARNSSATD